MKGKIVKRLLAITLVAVMAFSSVLSASAVEVKQTQVDLSKVFNMDGFAFDKSNQDGDFDNNLCTISADKIKSTITYKGTSYKMGSMADKKLNVIKSNGQKISLPAGKFKKLKLIAASTNGNKTGDFKVNYTDSKFATKTIKVVDWCMPDKEEAFKTYRHIWVSDGKFVNDTKHVVALHEYTIELDGKKTVKEIVLPNNKNIKIFAVTLLP